MNSVVPGSELTKEPFRWDQRIFGLVLRLPGNVPVDMTTSTYIPSAESHPLDAMCDVTGGKTENEILDFLPYNNLLKIAKWETDENIIILGRSYAVHTQKMLNGALESLVQKVQGGVVINFEKIGPDPPTIEVKVENGLDSNGNSKGILFQKINTSSIQSMDSMWNFSCLNFSTEIGCRIYIRLSCNIYGLCKYLDLNYFATIELISWLLKKKKTHKLSQISFLYCSPENQDINMPPTIKLEVEEERKANSPMTGLSIPNNSWHNCRKLIYVPRSAQKGYSVGHWPIPEAFWPDTTNSTLVSHFWVFSCKGLISF